MFTLFPIVVGILAAIGVIGCGVGVLATAPLYFTITAVAYRDIFGLEGGRASFVAPQLPNYNPQAYNQQSWANQPPQSYPSPGSTPPAWGSQPPSLFNPPQGQPGPPPMISPRQYPPQPLAQPPAQPSAPSQPAPETPPRPFAPPPADPIPPTLVMPPPDAPQPQPGSAEAGQTICPHCRALLQRTARFCNYCGKPLA